jgi:hypothetical protein
MSDPKRLWTFVSRFLGWLAFAPGLASLYLWFAYFDSGPRSADYSSGHVVPLNNHGNVHYITAAQDHKITVLQIIAGSLFAIGFLIQGLIVRPPKPKAWENKM